MTLVEMQTIFNTTLQIIVVVFMIGFGMGVIFKVIKGADK
jgi:hypothetical protein